MQESKLEESITEIQKKYRNNKKKNSKVQRKVRPKNLWQSFMFFEYGIFRYDMNVAALKFYYAKRTNRLLRDKKKLAFSTKI